MRDEQDRPRVSNDSRSSVPSIYAVGDVTDQITQFTSGDSVSSRDMVTLQAGTNDIVGRPNT